MPRMMEGMGQQSRAQSRPAAQIALNRIGRRPINENMVKAGFTIISLATALCAALLLVTSAGRVLEIQTSANAAENIEFVSNPVVQKVPPRPPEPVPAATATKVDGATLPPAVNAVLKSGVLIVISKPSQTMYVFKDGALWNSSPVSTGKRGHTTPSGMFPILQKRTFHRSNIYSNAPMPHMQRLTWGGIAIHAGKLPGYPASHGCIRLPADFARALFALTRPETTTVVVTDQRVGSDETARRVALNMPNPLPGARGHLVQRPEPPLREMTPLKESQPRLAQAEPTEPQTAQSERRRPALAEAPRSAPQPVDLLDQARPRARGQTIQLAAKSSPGEAEAYWSRISARYPELGEYEKAIIPAVVDRRQYYRLRVTGPGAFAACSSLKRAGTDCFPVQ